MSAEVTEADHRAAELLEAETRSEYASGARIRIIKHYSEFLAGIYAPERERTVRLEKALTAIIEAAQDGRSCPEWLTDHLAEARAALEKKA
jgi:hypothetical protein